MIHYSVYFQRQVLILLIWDTFENYMKYHTKIKENQQTTKLMKEGRKGRFEK